MTSRPQIWPSLARILNEVQPLLAEFNPAQLHDYPLPEDYDLQSFQPLCVSLGRYNYRQVSQNPLTDQERLRLLRCCRLTEVGRALTRLETPLLRYSSEQAQFVALEVEMEQGEEAEQLVEQLGESDGESSGSEGFTPEFEEDSPAGTGKGILKSRQSPVPKKRESGRHNVAMAAILRRAGLEGGAAAASTSPTLSSPSEDDRDKTVTFKTPSPVPSQTSTQDSQYSASQEDPAPPPPPASNRTRGRRGWSPPPVSRPKASLEDLDFSRPPPSLHSNYRPPALASPPPQSRPDTQIVQGINSIGSSDQRFRGEKGSLSYHSDVRQARPGPAYGGEKTYQQVGEGTYQHGGEGTYQLGGEGTYQQQQQSMFSPDTDMARPDRDWWQGKDTSPDSRPLPGFPRLPLPAQGPISPSAGIYSLPRQQQNTIQQVPNSNQQNPNSNLQLSNPTQQLSNPIQQHPNPTQQLSNPIQQHPNPVQQHPNPVQRHPNPVQQLSNPMHQTLNPIQQAPNPLLQLLSASHQSGGPRPFPPDTTVSQALPDLGSLSLGGLGPSWPLPQSHGPRPPQPEESQQGSPQHKMPQQTYSLFSPNAWPGPLLTGSPVNHQSSQPSTSTPSNMQLFGPGPSPLERLLHQAKNNK